MVPETSLPDPVSSSLFLKRMQGGDIAVEQAGPRDHIIQTAFFVMKACIVFAFWGMLLREGERFPPCPPVSTK